MNNERYQIWWQHRNVMSACDSTCATLREAIDASRDLHELTGYTITIIDTGRPGGAVIISTRKGT